MSTVAVSRKNSTNPQTPAVSRDPMGLLRQEMDDLVSRFFNGGQQNWFSGSCSPSVDLVESDNAYEVRMDIPGMEPRDINVQVSGNTVTLSGERKEEKEEKGKAFHRVERHHGCFSRTITLPCQVNENEVAAEYNKGVLTVKLPKCDEARTKKVAVKGN